MKLENYADLAFSLINAGSMWREAGEFERAIDRSREGISIYVARGSGFERQAQKGRRNLALALEGMGQWREALKEVSELLPYADGQSKQFSSTDAIVWLLAARLEARLDIADPSCDKPRRVMALDAAPESALEARLLLARCQMQLNDSAGAAETLTGLTASEPLLGKIDRFVRDWFVAQMR